jgi:hypothetical protein
MSSQPVSFVEPIGSEILTIRESHAMSAAEYIGTIFAPEDLICIMTLVQDEKPKHIFATVDEAASSDFIERLRQQNESGANIYICMNPLTAKRRIKPNIACIRTLYTDNDHNGAAALKKIAESSLAPPPHFILKSSPGKFQVIWLVKGIRPAEQERLLDALIQEFGGDPAASDCTRVLRLPGFINHKYPEKPIVEVIESNFDSSEYTADDFKVKVAPFKPAEKTPTIIEKGERNARLASLAGKLRREGFDEPEIHATLRTANQRCTSPLPDSEIAAIASSIARYAPAKNGSDATEPLIEVVPGPALEAKIAERLDMPRAVLSGRLGEMCEHQMLDDFPVSYAWLALVTAASVLVPERLSTGNGDNLHNLYTALVGPVNFGKSQAIEWALQLLRIQDDLKRYDEVKPGSAERLLKYMNRRAAEGNLGPRVLMALDEWKFFFDKAAIENSVFPTLLTTGFYKRNTTILDGFGRPLMVPAAFSWIGGIVTDSYDDCLSQVTALGLHDRLLQGINPSNYSGFNYRPFEGKRLQTGFEPQHVEIDRSVWECLTAWRGANPRATREAEIAFRIAVICASFDGAPTLYGKDLGPHLLLADEQIKLRATLKPNIGETPDAQCAIKVENYLHAHGPAGEWLDFRVMMKDIHYERFGPNIFKRTIDGLVYLKSIELGERPAAAGNRAGGRAAKAIRLVLD